jgi:hypothetical protein
VIAEPARLEGRGSALNGASSWTSISEREALALVNRAGRLHAGGVQHRVEFVELAAHAAADLFA